MLDQNSKKERKYLFILLSILGIIYLINAINFPGSFEGGDGLRHYLVSRYSWPHPEQLLYLWGKPFFTLVSSPFSQAGLIGIKVFNILCALLTCYVSYLIAGKLNLRRKLLLVLFTGFAPLYFFATNSGYTEILFGLIVVFAIYEYMNRGFFLSTILISFLPFVRSEGYLIIPLFFILLVIRRKFVFIPLLAAGNIIYSIIGHFYYNDILWLVHQNPYDGHMALIYGSGSLFHFVRGYKIIWGTPLFLLFIAGLIYALIRLLRRQVSDKEYSYEEYFLIYGSFLSYFLAHSIFWWKGLFNSLGLERVMIAVLPVSALISLRGINFILTFLKHESLQKLVIITFSILVIANPFLQPYFPLQLDPEEKLIMKVKGWYEESGMDKTNFKKFYLHPFLPEALSFDAFDTEKTGELWGLFPSINKWGYDAIPDSTLIFWDAHYGPNEANIPLDSLLKNNRFRLIQSFIPEQPFVVLGNYNFEIHVFQKVNPELNITENFLTERFDFETIDGIENTSSISETESYSGKKSAVFSKTVEFGPTITRRIGTTGNANKIQCVTLKFMALSVGPFEATAVLSFHKGEKQTRWLSSPVKYNNHNQWMGIDCQWIIDNAAFLEADEMKLYIWNSGKKSFYVDDFEINYLNKCN